MNKYPVVTKLICVAVVVSIVFPAGQELFPIIGEWIGETPFSALEALLSASLGYGLHAALFG